MKIAEKAVSVVLCAVMLTGCGAAAKANPEQIDSVPASAAQSEAAMPDSAQVQAEASASPAPMQNGLVIPADGISPVTGKASEFAGQRPVAVMLYNTRECRPQWGIGNASMMIEANTEGQDTRLMAVFEGCDDVEKAGPVGPARDVYLQMVLPFGVIPVFNGSDVYASNLLNTYGCQPIDGNFAGVTAFDYDSSRRAIYKSQYGWYTHKALLPGALELYGQSSEGTIPSFFPFAEGSAPDNQNGVKTEIRYGENRKVQLEFDGARYTMSEDGDPQTDGYDPANGVDFENVLVLMAASGVKNDRVTREYDLTEGNGIYLCSGGMKHVRWQKAGPAAPLKFYDETGNAISIQPGKTYLGIWGGFEGQSLKVFGADGSEQVLPESPEALPLPDPTPTPQPTPEPVPEETDLEQSE